MTAPHPARSPHAFVTSLADVFLGRACAGCDAPGISLCPQCRELLRPKPRLRRGLDLSDIAAGLHLPVTCSLDYRGAVRQVLYRFKDHRIPHLARDLGPALASSIAFAAEHGHVSSSQATVVTMPTRRSTARRRGFDPLGLVTAAAVRAHPVAAVRTSLVDTRRRGTSKSLGVWERHEAAAGAFEVRGRLPTGPVVLVDDIVTTGATAREAAATLILAGVHVVAVATIAGTP